MFSSLRSFRGRSQAINALEEHYATLSDVQLLDVSAKLRDQVRGGKMVEDVLAEAFALVREAAKRTLKQRHFDVQLIGGMVLAEGKIAEMATGEGKTLAATAPAYAHALTGKGVHVITVNDYLARRDAVWMAQVYYFLGISTSCITHDAAYLYDPSWHIPEGDEKLIDVERDATGSFRIQQEYLRPISRKDAYAADVVYGTNHEFGFDYLRDNLAYGTVQQVQRGHYFAIIDEVDSILIDEARTPLIISAPDAQSADYYKLFARLVPTLKKDEDYAVDEKIRSVTILESGIEKIERALTITDLYNAQNARLVHYLEESLKAHALFSRDRHYIVKNNEIIIVDEFTGRLMHGRRYSGGLHQAIEAKEGVRVQDESKTFAQITIQNYFRLYEKVSGMTGTAYTSAEEFKKVYGLDVVVIPTNKPRQRTDLPDVVYKNKEAKYDAITADVKERSQAGEPILIGTTSIDENELLASYFSQAGVAHEVLNAKNHEREGEIIAQAGRAGAVTLATNMAGRGVDIVLGGNPPDPIAAQRVRDAGGLYVIGTQRNDARRVDNQLRGRAGRQGDPGQTKFFLSLEDDMLRIFGGDRVKSLMGRLKIPENEPIESGMVERLIDEAQKKVEGFNFDARKHLFEYDTVLNKQRDAVYRRRQSMLERLEKGEMEAVLRETLIDVLAHKTATIGVEETHAWLEALGVPFSSEKDRVWLEILLMPADAQEETVLPESLEAIVARAARDPRTGSTIIGALDMLWTGHLENLEALSESVRIRAFGQKDPLVEYKRDSYAFFKTLIAHAQELAVANILPAFIERATVGANGTISVSTTIASQEKSITSTISASSALAGQAGNGSAGDHPKVGRNDPCWCGSGKKYKHCHGA
ncbi:MAG: preprotein translocase subunit SecA [Candidatus Paceibacterota bacterium]